MASGHDVPTTFTQESGGSQVVEQGRGKWWGKLLVPNGGANKDSHPNKCALGCGHTWTLAGCNATKQSAHICGDVKGVKICMKATDADKRLASSFRTSAPSNTRTPAFTDPTPKRSRAEFFVTGMSPRAAMNLEGQGNDRTADDAAVQEEIREQGLQGMFRHANSKAECEKLDLKWAEAIAHAGLPPSIIEDEYIRDAILQTSLASAPYTPAHRTTFETKLLPAVDAVRKGVRRE